MLRHLRITNFAILSDVEVAFGPGFNVLTGETGAGKSLIVDAVALLRGGRARSDIPRAGADEAVVEAVFEPPDDLRARVAARLEAAGLPAGDGPEVLVRRVVARGGRSRIHVNGGMATAAALAGIGELLVDLAGQHEHQGLVDGARQQGILDAFGVDPGLLERMGVFAGKVRALTEEIDATVERSRSRAEREDFLRYQVDEIRGARLESGEERALAEERERLRSSGKLVGAAQRAEDALYARESAVVDVLSGLLRELEPLAPIDPRLDAPLRQLQEAQILCTDAADALRRYAEGVSADPGRLDEIDDRLHLIGKLARKHGATCAEIIARGDALAGELAALVDGEARTSELRLELARVQLEAEAAAGALTAARRVAGGRLEKAVCKELVDLGMARARLVVSIEKSGEKPGVRGWDRVELLLGANAGETARGLAKVASGGELSRIMLALKLSLRRADPVGTYVFDEVDAGVGGAIAEAVGQKIRSVAEARQVICVTHLPQIAALADFHFRVEKSEVDGRTETAVAKLRASERGEEIARMLGGMKITARTRAHAQEMLKSARG